MREAESARRAGDAARAIRPSCRTEPGLCAADDTWVRFNDIGAGTTELIKTDRCLNFDGGGGGGPLGEACTFGDPSLPLLCDCACD